MLYEKGGRVSHNWCMGVAGRSYGGLGGMEMVACKCARQSNEWLVARRMMPDYFPSAR